MHPRNPYHIPPDFGSLADSYPPLKPFVVLDAGGRPAIDFTNVEGQRRLTEAILARDFRLQVVVPQRDCARRGRLNYILWIQDIMNAFPNNSPRNIHGMDHNTASGTGACAIYPLLACRLHPQWRFTATEADDYSWEHAKANVASNGLQGRICIEKAALGGPILFPLLQNPRESVDFTMCNPPFYSSREEVTQSAEMKEFSPSAVCTGADVEMITAMVEESTRIRTRCKWYTSMLGKLSSISDIITNYAITEFVQGRTRRWAVGWSFTDSHLPDVIARTNHPDLRALMPARNTLSQGIHIPSSTSRTQIQDSLKHILTSLEGMCARRRRHKSDPSVQALVSRQVMMTAECSVRRSTPAMAEKNTTVECRWMYGADRALFESFAVIVGENSKLDSSPDNSANSKADLLLRSALARELY
ncbi:hypothetical protein BD779DRAFT_1613461 [Infundibulicybe gibba]|nr:hypothetical protein BD779DRAFT_1613461 [Infundibulicybe gibba]